MRVSQFWDRGRLISRLMGERDRDSIVWDHVAVFTAGPVWETSLPDAHYQGGPVVKVIEPTRAALVQALR